MNIVTFTIVSIDSVFDKNTEYSMLLKKFPDYVSAMEQQADVSSFVIKED